MKWFKHESSASLDAKLQEVLLDYGLEGYGLYWYCLELISGTVTPDNLTFELEHDARIIARNAGSSVQRVEEMMSKFIELGLFEASDGVVKCLKLAKKTDEYTAKLLSKSRQTPDKLPTSSGQNPKKSVLIEKKRREKKRKRESENKFSDEHLLTAKGMFKLILKVAEKTKEPNFEKWANEIRIMCEQDNLTIEEVQQVFKWANNDAFWQANILSPSSLRKHFAKLHAEKNKSKNQPAPRPASAREMPIAGSEK